MRRRIIFDFFWLLSATQAEKTDEYTSCSNFYACEDVWKSCCPGGQGSNVKVTCSTTDCSTPGQPCEGTWMKEKCQKTCGLCDTGFSGCGSPDHKGDLVCDDENNNVGCDYDGGDCCLGVVNTTRCLECECKDPVEAIQKFKCYSGTGSSSGNIIAFKGKIRKEDCAVECLASGCAAFTIQNSGNCVLKSAYKLETDGVDKGKLTCVRTVNRTTASCKTPAEHVLVHGSISYTDPVEPRHERSRAIFTCDTGYQLSGAADMECREGQWSGAMPTCVDIDECDGIDCGGSSNCTNGIGKYICECAEGWHGGGVNKICELGYCKCTGNQGYHTSPNMVVDGDIKVGYDFGPAYGDYCKAWDDDEGNRDAFGHQSSREPWCYLPCDRSSCSVDLPRYETPYLWRAHVENFSLCYSFENCGGVDYFTNSVALDCARRGGYLIDWKCTCDISPGMCKGDTTIPIPSDTITPLASHNNSTSDAGQNIGIQSSVSVGGIVAIVLAVIATAIIVVVVVVVLVATKKQKHFHSKPPSSSIVGKYLDHGPRPVSLPVRRTDAAKTNVKGLSEHSLMDGRTFANSNYKRFYTGAKPAPFQHRLLGAVNDVLELYTARINPTMDRVDVEKGVQEFMERIQSEAFKHNKELQNDVAAVAEFLWTSAKVHIVVDCMELCTVLNAVIRDDVEEEIQAAVTIFRSLNTRRVTRKTSTGVDPSYPPKGETWRGGGFREACAPFFERMRGRKYRVPGFLATSIKRSVAANFAFRIGKNRPRAMWHIAFDPRGKRHPEYRVQHLTFVSKSFTRGEHEYLFPPYSVFTLLSITWSETLGTPHEFCIQAARDNQEEYEDLPLAPWY